MNTQPQIVTDNSPTPTGYKDFYVMHGELMDEQQLAEYYAQKEQEAIIAPVEPVAPAEDSSLIEQVGVGAVDMLGGIPAAAEAITHSDFLHNMNNNIEEWTKEHTSEEFGLKDMIARGLGSSAPLYIAGAGVVPVAMALGVAAPIALALSIPVTVLLESMIEGGQRYRKSLAEHGDEDKASAEAALTFAGNIPLNAFTETLLGPLGRIKGTGLAGAAKTVGKAMVGGAIEEPAQLLISEGSAGYLPSASEFGTEALVGGIVSGIIGTGFTTIDAYSGKKKDFTGTDLDATRAAHKEETNKETPLISMDTIDQVLAKAEEEFTKTVIPEERRADSITRIEVDRLLSEGKTEEVHKLLFEDPVTGLMNRRALELAVPEATAAGKKFAYIDVTGLGYINKLSHKEGDKFLQGISSTLTKQGINLFRVGGDELVAIIDDNGESLTNAKDLLSQTPFDFTSSDGSKITYKGISFDFGVGSTVEQADTELTKLRKDLKAAGKRAKKEEPPLGLVRVTPFGNVPEAGKVIPSGKPIVDEAIVDLTEEVKSGIRINLIGGKEGAIDQMIQARKADADGAYRLYKDAVNRAIREGNVNGLASIDSAVADALGVPPMLEVELSSRLNESPINKKIAELESIPDEQRTPELQKRIDDNKVLLDNTTIAKQLTEVKGVKKATTVTRKKGLFKEVRIEGDKLISTEALPVTPLEGVAPTKRGKKTSVPVDKFSSDYVDSLIEDKNIYSIRQLQVTMEDEIDKLDMDLLDYKKGSLEYDTIKNRMDALEVQISKLSNARLKIAGSDEFVLDSLGLQKAYELLRNPNLLASQVMENLKVIGDTIYDTRMRVTDFIARMQDKLGSLYDGFKHHLITLFDIIKNQRGMWGSLDAAGKVRQEIRGRAYRDLGDKKWKMWIDDADVTLNPGVMTIYNEILTLNDPNAPGRPSVDVGQLINLVGTFTGYPELQNIQVTTAAFDGKIVATLDPNKGTIYINEKVTEQTEIVEALIHELQHAIQFIEGWSTGTSSDAMKHRMLLSRDYRDIGVYTDKIADNLYWNTIAEMQARDAAIRTLDLTFQEQSGLDPYMLEDLDRRDTVDIEGNDIIELYDDAPYGVRENSLWLITKDTSPTVAAERLIKLDTIPLASNDIRKGLVPAQRYEDGTIVTGESQMKIGLHSDRETTELGWVKRTFEHEDFIPESAFAPHEVANTQNKLFGKEKVNMLELVMNAKKVVDPTGQASTDTFNEEKMDIQDKVRKNLIRFEKAANAKGMALDNYLRDIGFSDSAVSELMSIHNSSNKEFSYIRRVTKSQLELLHKLEQEKKIDLAAVKAEIGITDIEGKKMTYADASKLINYIQVNKGIKLDSIIDIEVLLNNIENDVISKDTMTELKRTKAFVMQMFLSPDIVLSSTPTGKQIYNVLDKAVVLINKGKERIFGETGFDIDAYDELIKVESITSERIAAVLDGQAQYKNLTASEQTVVDKMRIAFKYMLNEFVDKKSADANEATLVRQLAPSVKYEVGETASVVKKKLHALQTEYNISKGGMEALDLLRMERENYLPHIFDSQEIIKTAVLKLEKLIQVDPLSPKVEQLRNTIARLSGGDFVMQSEIPNELYFAHLEERNDVGGYKMDAGLAFHTYVKGWLRKMYLEPAVNVAKDLYIQLPATQKPYAKWFILEVAGRNKRTPGASYVSMLEWIRLIGFNMGSALTNATGVLNTFADSGAHGIEGMQRAMTAQGRQEFYREGLGYETRFKASPVEELHGKIEKLRKISGILFDQVELGNRMHAFHTGKSKGESIGLKGDELTSYAIDFMHKVQFRYGITGMAKGMRGWPGVATQFSSFTVKQWELILGKWRKEPEGLKKIVAYLMLSAGANTMLRFIGMDISNAAGIPLNYGDLLKAVTSASEGDWEKATKHWKLSAQGGTGILPREVIMTGPAVNLLMQIKDTHSPDWLGRIGNELSPPLANKAIDFYYGLKHGNAKDNEFPIYAYESKDPLKKALEGPRDLKYTLSLYGLVLRTFGPRPTEETEIQRKEFARLLTTQEITSILSKYDKALASGNVDKMTELFNLYPGVIYDRGTGALKRKTLDLQLTREQRSLFKRKSAQRAATLDAE